MPCKRFLPVLSLVLAIFFPAVGITQEGTNLKVSESAIATGVENLTPQGVSVNFPSNVGNIYAFSKITGSTSETTIKHLWFYGDKFMAEVTLPVKSISWRTYSSKIILPVWKGQWRVDITAEDGTVLNTLNFTIQ